MYNHFRFFSEIDLQRKMAWMRTTIYLLPLLFAPTFAYLEDLESCLNNEVTAHSEVQKILNAISACNEDSDLNQGGTACEDFNNKIDYDHCLFREMGWTDENETTINYAQWNADNEKISTFMGYTSEENWEKFDDCMCEMKTQLRQTGIALMCPTYHGVGHLFLSAAARCAIAGMKASCLSK